MTIAPIPGLATITGPAFSDATIPSAATEAGGGSLSPQIIVPTPDSSPAPEIGVEFVRLKVDVIVTVGTAVPALKQLTSVIPIIFAAALDPVGSGLVASLARPGGNVTGLSAQSTELVTKRIEFLREILHDLRRMAVMGNVGYSGVLLEMREVEAAARTLGLEIDTAELRRAEDISPAFDAFKSRVQALYVCADVLVNANSVRINTPSARIYPRCTRRDRRLSTEAASWPMDQTTRTCFAAQVTMSTRFCEAPSLAIFRSSSRPSSISSLI